MPLYDYNFFEYFNALERKLKANPLNLGGIISVSGGTGGPPGGYTGMLPQTRVSYDLTEAELSGFVSGNPYDASGVVISASLLDNLNHIRYRIKVLEVANGGGFSIYENDTPVASGVMILDFKGGVSVSDVGSGEVEITVSGGPTGVESFVDLDDVPSSYTGMGDKLVAVKDDETGLEFIDAPSPTISGEVKVIGFVVTSGLQTGTIPIRMLAPWGGTITEVAASVWSAPTVSSIILDINKNGTTIFTTQSNRPSIAAGSQDGFTYTIDVDTFSKNDVFTCDVDQVGVSPGENLVVQVRTLV
jgi:hypothetical protein